MSARQSLLILDATYALNLAINQALVKFHRHQRPGLGRRMEESSFDLRLWPRLPALWRHFRLLVRMSADLAYLPTNRLWIICDRWPRLWTRDG